MHPPWRIHNAFINTFSVPPHFPAQIISKNEFWFQVFWDKKSSTILHDILTFFFSIAPSQGLVRPHLRNPFPCTALLVQSNWLFLIASQWHNDCSRSIDWLVADSSATRLAVVFLPNDCLFLTAFKLSSRNIHTPKKVARSGPKWPKMARSG